MLIEINDKWKMYAGKQWQTGDVAQLRHNRCLKEVIRSLESEWMCLLNRQVSPLDRMRLALGFNLLIIFRRWCDLSESRLLSSFSHFARTNKMPNENAWLGQQFINIHNEIVAVDIHNRFLFGSSFVITTWARITKWSSRAHFKREHASNEKYTGQSLRLLCH